VLVHRHAHEHESASPRAGIQWGLHGHDHEARTPDHDHPVVGERATAPARAAAFGLTLVSAALAECEAAAVSRGEPGCPVARARNGPLRVVETISILRV
jgi:hypothetical protein